MTKIENTLTIAEAASQFGVTPQRMHVLIQTYDVKTIVITSRFKLVSVNELRKIPTERPPGPIKNRD